MKQIGSLPDRLDTYGGLETDRFCRVRDRSVFSGARMSAQGSLSEVRPRDRDVRSTLRGGHRQVTTAGRKVPFSDSCAAANGISIRSPLSACPSS